MYKEIKNKWLSLFPEILSVSQSLLLLYENVLYSSHSLGLWLTQRKWNQHNWHSSTPEALALPHREHTKHTHPQPVAFHIKKLLFYSSSKSRKVRYIHTHARAQTQTHAHNVVRKWGNECVCVRWVSWMWGTLQASFNSGWAEETGEKKNNKK